MTLILVLLVLYTFVVVPLGELGLMQRPVLDVAFLAVLAAATLAYVRRSGLARLFIAAVVGLAVTSVLGTLIPSVQVRIADALFGLAAGDPAAPAHPAPS